MQDAIRFRQEHRGLMAIAPKLPVRDNHRLSLVYTPGVAAPCLAIAEDHLRSFDLTMRGNTVALVSDGSSVFGLGSVGPLAALPMLEAKAVVHKTLAGVDALPLVVNTQDVDALVETVRLLAPTFGGFHLDGIASPRCFEVEEKLRRAVPLPIFQASQHAAAVSVTAALLNALKIVEKALPDIRVVINGAGAAGVSIARLLKFMGVGDVKICDRYGLLHYDRSHNMNWLKAELARQTNKERLKGSLEDVLPGSDVFIGVSVAGRLTQEMIRTMGRDPIVMALALPEPEIHYDEAKAAGARVVVTSRGDFPNQAKTSLVYPGIFRGALDVRATDINASMLRGAAEAIAALVSQEQLNQGRVLPNPLESPVAARVAFATAEQAIATGVAQRNMPPKDVEQRVLSFMQHGEAAWIEPADPAITADSPVDEQAMDLRRCYQGVIVTQSSFQTLTDEIYDAIHSPPQAALPSQLIQAEPDRVYDLTAKSNLVAVITDGSAVLGLGNIGPAAGLPVMEGKSVLFKTFGGVEAFPICLRTQDVDEFVEAVKRIAPSFGGINLEDIAAPRCFEIEKRLIAETDIPIFHDDQHGTAIVTVAAVLNAVQAVGKQMNEVRVAVSGAGAAALSVSQLLLQCGIRDILICDRQGVIYQGREEGMNPFKESIAQVTNLTGFRGTLAQAMREADIFIGLSAPGMVTGEMVRSMAKDPIILAMANPKPEIMPDEARAAGAKIIATGRSDFPNQVNNCLAFPGLFRGVLDVRARLITDDLKLAAARAIAQLITEAELSRGIIIPGALDYRVPPAVAQAVAQAAIETGVARCPVPAEQVAASLKQFILEGSLASLVSGAVVSGAV